MAVILRVTKLEAEKKLREDSEVTKKQKPLIPSEDMFIKAFFCYKYSIDLLLPRLTLSIVCCSFAK